MIWGLVNFGVVLLLLLLLLFCKYFYNKNLLKDSSLTFSLAPSLTLALSHSLTHSLSSLFPCLLWLHDLEENHFTVLKYFLEFKKRLGFEAHEGSEQPYGIQQLCGVDTGQMQQSI